MPQVSRFVTAARRKDQKSALHPSFKANFPPSPRKDDYDSEAPDFLCTINKVVQWVKELPEYFFLSSRHMSSFNQDRPAATLKRPANVRFSEQVERGNSGKDRAESEAEIRLRLENCRMLEEAFREFDTDQSGDICQKELRNILRSLGHNPSEGEVNELMAKVDVDCSGYLDIEEFLEFMDSHYCFNEPVSDLWPIFRMLTPDGSKMVRIGKVREMFMKNSGNMNEFNEMVQSYADDTSIDFEEFVRLVTGIELAKKGRR